MAASPSVESPLLQNVFSYRHREDRIAHSQPQSPAAKMATAAVISPSILATQNLFMPPTSSSSSPQAPTVPYPTYTSPSKRPKLSLNTSCSTTRTIGKGNTGLRLDTITSTSPTLRNTYKNAYESSTTHNQTLTHKHETEDVSPPHTPVPDGTLIHTPHDVPSSTESSPEIKAVPYTRLHTVHSVLKNGPLPRQTPTHGSRPRNKLFPRLKSVQFRENLTEEIETRVYTVKHSDMTPSEAGGSDDSAPSTPDRPLKEGTRKRSSPSSYPVQANPATTQNDDNEDDEDEANDDEATHVKTPVAGRSKRSRKWIWTLDPLPSSASSSTIQGESSPNTKGKRLAAPVEDDELS